MRVERIFSTAGVHPFDQIEWELRRAEIKDEKGKIVFSQDNVEVPNFWSQLATNIVASKYFHGDKDKGFDPSAGGRESSVKQLISRVADTMKKWGIDGGYFDTKEDADIFGDELTWLCVNQHGAFNSPVWFNVGLWHKYGVGGSGGAWHWDEKIGEAIETENAYQYPQGSACFILPVKDTMSSIMSRASAEAALFKFGSGAGSDNSRIRSSKEKLSGGGKPSGPLSFMKIYDATASVIKSGGVTRRAAKMEILRCDHPDIFDFVAAKGKEEKKAHALIREGYESNFNGEAYATVNFQNSNLSVRVTDHFMRSAEAGDNFDTIAVTTGDVVETFPAKDLLHQISTETWNCGDPGLQYDDTIQRWHTCPNTDRIWATNPCSEFVFLDDTSCNLASINLMKFRLPDGAFDMVSFRSACRIFITAQEILVDNASYPTKAIAERSHAFRPLGLGYANLGCYLMSNGIAYDSDRGRSMAAAITANMHGEAYLTSSIIAHDLGPFSGFSDNREPMLKVIDLHLDATNRIGHGFGDCAKNAMAECQSMGYAHGYRNSQVTVLAPTGTIAFMMDCDTTGVEPDIALVKYKSLAGGGMLKIVNQSIGMALDKLGYSGREISDIKEFVDSHDTIEVAPHLKSEHLPVFDCAFVPENGVRSIEYHGHIKMMAAIQPFLSGAISKTVNMPEDSTVEDIAGAYLEAWKLGLKAVAIYRDGSKKSQPLNTKSLEEEKDVIKDVRPVREKLPTTRNSITHKFDIQGHEGYITVGLYPDGRPGEIFIKMSKEGSTIGGFMDVFGTAVSIGLQYGVPLEDLIGKFIHTNFEPSGFTKNSSIPMAKSIPDYIFRWLQNQFTDRPLIAVDFSATDLVNLEVKTKPRAEVEAAYSLPQSKPKTDKSANKACDKCGGLMIPTGRCYACTQCGESGGCS